MRQVSLNDTLLHTMRELAENAGRLAMRSFRPGLPTLAEVTFKNGTSPVTQADLDVDVYLRRELLGALPDAGWLSEETADDRERLARRRVFVVDPIDGTRAFMNGHPCWSISIALVEYGQPVLAVLHAPALNETFLAVKGCGMTLNDIVLPVSAPKADRRYRAAGPKPWLERLGQSFDLDYMAKVPSLAYRLALVAVDRADIALASPNANDWDIAAADLLISEAGGCLTDLNDMQPIYNRQETRHGALVAAHEPLHKAALTALHNDLDIAVTL